MNRKEAIQHVEQLYPVDSHNPSTAAEGRRLLDQARREVLDWRNEPIEVLVRYAQLCIEKEQSLT